MTDRICLNCGTELMGRYCHACGQKDQERRLPVKHVFKEVLHDLWHLDAKIWETAKLLALRPAALTQEYLAGRRTRHVPPFRLYIFVSFVLFLLLSFNSPVAPSLVYKKGGQSAPAATKTSETERTIASGPPSATENHAANQEKNPQAEAPETHGAKGLDGVLERGAQRAMKDPHKAQSILFHNFPRAMFLLLPLFALLLQVAFWNKKRYFVEHMTFSLHEHTYAFLVFIAMWLLARLPWSWPGWISFGMFMTLPVHLGVGMKRMYGVGTLRTLLTGAVLTGVYALLILSVLLLTVIVSLAQL